MQTFRRLNDAELYYGLSWRGWLGAGAGGAILYAAIRLSPLGVKPTISLTGIALAFAGTVLYGLSGQAIGPGRFLIAADRHAISRKQLTPPARPDSHGLVLDGRSASTPSARPAHTASGTSPTASR
ncbi:MAG: hypothetical protein ACLP01_13775 [Solirubrobacteraceae bacterium]